MSLSWNLQAYMSSNWNLQAYMSSNWNLPVCMSLSLRQVYMSLSLQSLSFDNMDSHHHLSFD